MSDEEKEYEVDFIVEANIIRKGRLRKPTWSFKVRWKGFTPDDDTDEPLESFEDSMDIVEHFWDRAGDQRDFRQLDQFKAGEKFVPTGPPRKKKRKTTEETAASSSKSNEVAPIASEPTPPPAPASSNKRRRRSAANDEAEAERPSKRTRDAAPRSASARLARSTISPVRTSARQRQPPPAPVSSAKKGKAKQAKRQPSPEVIPDSDEEVENGLRLDKDFRSTNSSSNSQADVTDLTQDKSPSPEAPARPKRKTVAQHRKPKVKVFEDPNLVVPEGSLSAKTRAVERTRATRASATEASTSARPKRVSTARPTSARAAKSKASLLTAQKDGLKTVKGRYAKDSKQNDDNPEEEEYEECLPAPKPEELLSLAGLDVKEAEDLPDFADDAMVVEQEGKTEAEKQKDADAARAKAEADAASAERAKVVNQVAESLFSSSSSLPAPVFAPTTWRQSTIFGPLTLGVNSTPPSIEADFDSVKMSPFSLELGAETSLPTLFTDVSPPEAKLTSTTASLFKYAPGKFFNSATAANAINAIRAGSGYARLVIRSDANEDAKKNFARFVKRLNDDGGLFIASSGLQGIYVFCSSSNTELCDRLNVPASVRNHKGQVLVSKVLVNDSNDYAAAAERADPRSWSEYVASLP